MEHDENTSPPPTVRPLSEVPEWIPVLADWHHREWGWLNPGKTFDDRVRKLEKSAVEGRIPCTVVASIGDTPLGSASLVERDMDTRPHLGPWLASVYVAPAHRGKGAGSALVEAATAEARKLGVGTLYLFTPNRSAFYRRLGWSARENTRYRGQAVTIMEKDLSRPPPHRSGP